MQRTTFGKTSFAESEGPTRDHFPENEGPLCFGGPRGPGRYIVYLVPKGFLILSTSAYTIWKYGSPSLEQYPAITPVQPCPFGSE